MLEPTPKTILLKDYTPPEFLIERAELLVDLNEQNTLVTSRLQVRRNPASVGPAQALLLDGQGLELKSIKLNGLPISECQYRLTTESLVIQNLPHHPFEIETVVQINPKTNTALEGLYLSDGMFCTQCEAQGFRKISFFPDRPDIMTRFTTTLTADKRLYPVLLSNGNLLAGGDLLDGRHWAKWEDPFPKPCYLFALVAGKLSCLEDHYMTGSGRLVTLRIFAEAQDLDKCGHAMNSLKNAMAWDEHHYGREYDLDLYMVVAVSHFNMGAMENKGLNIFNTRYVLARPDTATDEDYENIEGVIGHEYFHNWTGNRVTCRDWFQLSLKEGLTVFRDQQFTADRHSPAIKRIDDVNMLRTRQFSEDAGPLSHPIRPESYIEINNFYTLTVYEKGAEVVRMLYTLLGKTGFRAGTDLYFTRHDGQAITCEDFIQCMEDANQVDLAQFRLWYSQAGTPEITLHSRYDAERCELELITRQSCPSTPGQPRKESLLIPLAIGLLDSQGHEMGIQLSDEALPSSETTRILQLRDKEQRFRFVNVPERPVISALRGFSAPVVMQYERSRDELAFLFTHDSDTFTRWDAGQQLATLELTDLAKQFAQHPTAGTPSPLLVDALRHLVQKEWTDLSYLALMLTLPSEDYVGSAMEIIDPIAIHKARHHLKHQLANRLETSWEAIYAKYHRDDFNRFDATAIGSRRLKNVCLDYLITLDHERSHEIALNQFTSSRTMTDRIAALRALVNSGSPLKDRCLDEFYQQWQGEDLVIGKWFSLQAACQLPDTLERVTALIQHPAFDLGSPNHVRALIGVFCQSNAVNFHNAKGAGYRFLADHVLKLDDINPQIASRLVANLASWRRYDTSRQQQMREQLERIANKTGISSDVYEVASKALV